jgi:hypothetical protein
MTDRLQLIPLDLLIDAPAQYSRRGKIATARLLLRTVVGQFETWQWCLGFALCNSLVGFLLLACSVNPYGISSSLLAPGVMYSVCMLHPRNRLQPIAYLVPTYGAWSVMTLGFAIIDIAT